MKPIILFLFSIIYALGLAQSVVLPSYQGVYVNHPDCVDVTDIDGNLYSVQKFGDQCWMVQNLRTTHYNDGTPITKITDNTEWVSQTDAAYCWYNNDSVSYSNVYGALYNWYTVENPKLCPQGWHIASDAEWKQLEMFLGLTEAQADAGGWRGNTVAPKMAGNETLWLDGSLDAHSAFGSSGFNALPNGYRNYATGMFLYQGEYAEFWTGTEVDSSEGRNRYIKYNLLGIFRGSLSKKAGFSLRCVKD